MRCASVYAQPPSSVTMPDLSQSNWQFANLVRHYHKLIFSIKFLQVFTISRLSVSLVRLAVKM